MKKLSLLLIALLQGMLWQPDTTCSEPQVEVDSWWSDDESEEVALLPHFSEDLLQLGPPQPREQAISTVQSNKRILLEVGNQQETLESIEQLIQDMPERLPTWEPTGGLTYTMSPEEIQQTLTKKLTDLYKKGRIVTKEQFEQMDKDEWFWRGTNLTRVWGAQHLRNKGYKSPEHLLVVDNLDDIQLQIKLLECFPVAFTLLNGTIYAKKIDGTPAAFMFTYDKEFQDKTLYSDLAKDNNILRAHDGFYIVDTEYKSFHSGYPGGTLYEDMPGGIGSCYYLKARFKVLHNIPLDAWTPKLTAHISVK